VYSSQPEALFRRKSTTQKQVSFENTARSIGDVPREIRLGRIGNGRKTDPAYGEGGRGAKALGVPLSEVSKQPRCPEAHLDR
jgi:catalase